MFKNSTLPYVLASLLFVATTQAQEPDLVDLLESAWQSTGGEANSSLDQSGDTLQEALDAETRKNVQVNVGPDGNLTGRIQVATEERHTAPEEASISLALDGDVVTSAEVDERGYFRLDGLKPGDYVAVAQLEGQPADFDVNVQTPETGAECQSSFMDVILTPTPDVTVQNVTATNGLPTDGSLYTSPAYPGSSPMGGGSGFVGGGGALAGLAGLAGVAGIAASNNKKRGKVSPVKGH